MTIQTTHPHPISTRTVAAAFAGAVLAASAGYGLAALVLDEAPAPTPVEPTSVPGNPDPPNGLFPGTNREERALMHRD